jgi:hypothetical protein
MYETVHGREETGISEGEGTIYAVTNETAICSKKNQVAFQAIKCINHMPHV